MFRKLLPRSIYDVMAAIACFGVLAGGTAYAANTVFSSDIVDGEVKSIDIGNGEVKSSDVKDESLTTFDISTMLGADVVDGTLSGADVGDNSLTGADVDESTLNLATGPWHEVGTPGEPPFIETGSCVWSNFDGLHNSAAFLRDRFGFVHLKGLVDADDGASGSCNFDPATSVDPLIFFLPAGFHPTAREVHATLTNGQLGRITVDALAGAVAIFPPTTSANAKEWVSLDGISFRCACP